MTLILGQVPQSVVSEVLNGDILLGGKYLNSDKWKLVVPALIVL